MAQASKPTRPSKESLSNRKEEGDALRAEILDYVGNYQPSHFNNPPDKIDGQYTIDCGKPLPEFSTGLAKAFHVTDESAPDRALYALICAKNLPARISLARALRDAQHPHLIKLVTFGIAHISAFKEQRMVLIYEKPKGKRLSAIIAEQSRALADAFIAERIILPLSQAIGALEALGVCHGRINPENIYYGEHIVLGECIAEPCGYSQDYRFETVSRIQTAPAGKESSSTAPDYYALGIVAAWIKFGYEMFTERDPDTHLRNLLRDGAYNTLIISRNLSDLMSDFLRGTINDNVYERWKANDIKNWHTGKRANLLPPSVMSAGSRAFSFEGEEYSNFSALAQALYTYWSATAPLLRDGSLARWVELSARRRDIAELLVRSVRSLGGEVGRNERQNSELTARCLSVLDPHAPMRMKTVCVHVEGIGPLLAEYFRTENEQGIQQLADIIDQGLANIWGELQRRHNSEHLPADLSTAIWNAERVRPHLRSGGYGFGMERLLYELNPDLPCQSPLLNGFYVTTMQQLIFALDHVAAQKIKEDVPLDRHIAAFVATKISMIQEANVTPFKHIPELYRHKGLIALKLLTSAQEKSGNSKVPALSAWVIYSITDIFDHLFSKSLGKELAKALRKMASAGHLKSIAELLFHPEFIAADQKGFESAAYKFAHIDVEIAQLKNPNYRMYHAMQWGHSLARLIAYAIFMGVLMMVTQGQLNS